MKFHWFHLMPYAYFPSDFSKRYASIWVTVPRELYDPKRGHYLYNRYLDELELADRLGFDGIGVNEHHQSGFGLMPSPNLMAAALARRTRHAALLVLGDSLALYRPPIRVAEEFAMLDVLSGGRVIAGMVLGTAMDTAYCYGVVPAELRERFQEAYDLITHAWTAEEPFSFNGKYTKLRYVNPWPRPLQRPHPPIWVPGSGSLETWEWVARHDHAYGYLSFAGMKQARSIVDGYWETVARVGGDTNPHRFAFTQLIAVSETDAQAQKDYEEHAHYFFRVLMRVSRHFADAPGYKTIRSLTAEMERGGRSVAAIRGDKSWKDYVEEGYIIAGSPETVRQRLREAAQQLRVGQLIAQLHFGSMPHELVVKNTELFAREVMPYLRDLWAEYPDRWVPVRTEQHTTMSVSTS